MLGLELSLQLPSADLLPLSDYLERLKRKTRKKVQRIKYLKKLDCPYSLTISFPRFSSFSRAFVSFQGRVIFPDSPKINMRSSQKYLQTLDSGLYAIYNHTQKDVHQDFHQLIPLEIYLHTKFQNSTKCWQGSRLFLTSEEPKQLTGCGSNHTRSFRIDLS